MAVADRTHVILRAACSVIAERGCDGMRMGDVARAAGVSSALVHYYFDTRSELLRRASTPRAQCAPRPSSQRYPRLDVDPRGRQ